MDDDEEKSFCYIEGSVVDKNASSDISELHENVWYRMKPPRQAKVMYAPFVSARQIDMVRNMLLGKTTLKDFDMKGPPKEPCPKKTLGGPPRRDVAEKPCLKTRKSSVRFLNQLIYE